MSNFYVYKSIVRIRLRYTLLNNYLLIFEKFFFHFRRVTIRWWLSFWFCCWCTGWWLFLLSCLFDNCKTHNWLMTSITWCNSMKPSHHRVRLSFTSILIDQCDRHCDRIYLNIVSMYLTTSMKSIAQFQKPPTDIISTFSGMRKKQIRRSYRSNVFTQWTLIWIQ